MLAATLGPVESFLIARDLGAAIEGMAADRESVGTATGLEMARRLRHALAQMQASGSQLRNLSHTGDETTKPAAAMGRASSAIPPRTPPVTVSQVVERVGWSPQYVRRLCDAGSLSATKVRGKWLIDAWSVEDIEARRQLG